jgi:hypothetical protein
MHFSPTIAADFDAIGAPRLDYRIRGVTAHVNGRIVGIGGLGFLPDGSVMAFAHLTDEARAARFALHRKVCRELAAARKRYPLIIALADPDQPAAERWLTRLGFKPADPPAAINGHKVFAWQAGSNTSSTAVLSSASS